MKPTLRIRFLVRKHERPLEDYKVIGHRWKCGNACSLMILIGRKLDFSTICLRTIQNGNDRPSDTVARARMARPTIT